MSVVLKIKEPCKKYPNPIMDQRSVFLALETFNSEKFTWNKEKRHAYAVLFEVLFFLAQSTTRDTFWVHA